MSAYEGERMSSPTGAVTKVPAAKEGAPEPDRTSATFTLRLLHAFELRRQGAIVSLPISTQRLVAFLALRNRPLHRLHVAGSLWIDATEKQANACLRTALWRLRRFEATVIAATSTHLVFSDAVAVDVRDAAALATDILHGGRGGEDPVLALSQAGELLPDWYEDWVLIERERLRQLVMHALERLSADATAAGRFADATEAGLAAVGQEPLRESAHRLVVEAHLADGNPSEALRQYRLFSRLLAAQLELEPSPRMKALVARLPLGDDGVT
jgi:DNA-binding SARP family transcriptional activator